MAAYRGGSDAASLIYPEPAPRSRDHHKENLRQIRSKQRNNRAQAMEKEREARRPAFRNHAMDNVKARVDRSGHAAANAAMEKNPVTFSGKPIERQGKFLKAGERKQRGPPKAPAQPYKGREKKLAAVPKAGEVEREQVGRRGRREDRDFEQQQLKDLEALQQKQRDKQKQLNAERRNAKKKEAEGFGKVPEYLADRRQELAEEQRYLEEMSAQPDMPPGWQRMPDAQRNDLLAQLQEAHAKKSEALQRMPFMCESVSRRRAKQELESELLECERSIAMFSKPVFVDPRGGLTNNGPQEPAQAAAAYGADRWERPLQ